MLVCFILIVINSNPTKIKNSPTMSEDSSYEEDNNFYDDEEEEDYSVTLVPCDNCGRNFNQDSLLRHKNICKKLKKRKVFDSKKQRLQGIPVKTITASSAPPKIPKKKADWRATHNDFIKTIRAARGVTAALKSGSELPPPPSPTFNPDYVQCPHCDRRFNESAAERHIGFCKDQKSRLPKNGDSKYGVNKEKQDKRIQYRSPVPGLKKPESSPVKAKSAALPAGSKNNSLPVLNKKVESSPLRSDTKSDTRFAGKDMKLNFANENEDKFSSNIRYGKTSSGSAPSSADKLGKNRSGDPKWLEELKRNDSAKSQTKIVNEFIETKSNSSSKRALPSDPCDVNSGRRKVASFCHDCGAKYPVPAAKFCCECGVRRMALV
ncbi:zinc finger C2HC domain-containing protein 1B isoform X6 [Hydra vulgaris]|uniref:Zinc finger C2HC domain-containing protein 1B isoform X6 n=1 Tax=Hydra vulgaris TaxID=6087 RepID=A0ABM4BT55_HYDVU